MSTTKLRPSNYPWSINSIANWIDTDDFFSDDFFTKSKNVPAMNIRDKEEAFEVELAVPGFSKDDIDISIENDILTIEGKNSHESEDEDADYTRKDFSYSSFSKKIRLPDAIDTAKDVEAVYKDGVLKLELMKKEEQANRTKRTVAIH